MWWTIGVIGGRRSRLDKTRKNISDPAWHGNIAKYNFSSSSHLSGPVKQTCFSNTPGQTSAAEHPGQTYTRLLFNYWNLRRCSVLPAPMPNLKARFCYNKISSRYRASLCCSVAMHYKMLQIWSTFFFSFLMQMLLNGPSKCCVLNGLCWRSPQTLAWTQPFRLLQLSEKCGREGRGAT